MARMMLCPRCVSHMHGKTYARRVSDETSAGNCECCGQFYEYRKPYDVVKAGKKATIIGDWDKCYLCGAPATDQHHLFGAANRRLSEDDGLKVRLCRTCHMAIHDKGFKADELHRLGQTVYEQTHTREEFVRRYGRNWLG